MLLVSFPIDNIDLVHFISPGRCGVKDRFQKYKRFYPEKVEYIKMSRKDES